MHDESGVTLYWSVQQLEECFINPFLDNSEPVVIISLWVLERNHIMKEALALALAKRSQWKFDFIQEKSSIKILKPSVQFWLRKGQQYQLIVQKKLRTYGFTIIPYPFSVRDYSKYKSE